ncbi:MAG: type IV pilus assembly protein PilM [Actinomycetota bacterium]
MSKIRIGLDIGATAVRAAELSGSRDEGALSRAAQVALEPGAVAHGEIRDPAAVVAALKELWRQGGFRSRQVYLGVGNQRVLVREIVLPWLPTKELRESLRYQVQDFIPIPVDEAVLDFDVLEEFEHEGAQMIRVLLVAAQRSMVDTLLEVAREAKLEPQGLDLAPFALLRAVGEGDDPVFGNGGDEAIVDVGAEVTSLCVHDKGVPRFVRILPTGGYDITLAVARALDVPEADAELLKRGEEVAGADLEDARQVADGRASTLIDEIRSSLEFYAAQTPGAHIARVVVTGGGSKLPGFCDLLQTRLGVLVERGRLSRGADSSFDVDEEIEPHLAVAVGLAIPGGAR